jgi:hypothetical protein
MCDIEIPGKEIGNITYQKHREERSIYNRMRRR